MIDWQTIGGALGALVVGIGGFAAGRGKRQVESAAAVAEVSIIEMLRAEVNRLSVRLTAMEAREGRLIRHVYRLEGLMKGANMEVPMFDIDASVMVTP